MRQDICETLNKVQKPMMGRAVAEGNLHRSILHKITRGDEGERETGLFFF